MYGIVVDDLTSTVLSVDSLYLHIIIMCLLQEWGLLDCGSWALVCSG